MLIAAALAGCGSNAILGSGDGNNPPTDTPLSEVVTDTPGDRTPIDDGGDVQIVPDVQDAADAQDEGTDAMDETTTPDGGDGGPADAADAETSTPPDAIDDPSGDGPIAMDVFDGGSDDAEAGTPPADALDVPFDPDSIVTQDAVVCTMGTTRCGDAGACVDLRTDPANCGMCGMACPGGQVCAAGACACPMGQTSCGGACVDTQSNPSNCGMCGTTCPAGQACTAGACACPMGSLLCGGACVDAQSDNANCGMCGMACPMGRTCTAGACACPMGQTSCGTGATAACVNTQTDNANCGACGMACTGGATCVMGACACPTGQTRCGTGATATCVDTNTDGANCGMCGTACTGTQVCSMGMCTTTCAPPTVACGTGAAMTCANTQNDDQNCGACGTVCGTVPNSFGGLCTNGSCRPICTSGFANCNTMYADGCEVNTTNNASNCGACGNTCRPGEPCVNSVCGCTGGTVLCGATCQGPVTGAPVPNPTGLGSGRDGALDIPNNMSRNNINVFTRLAAGTTLAAGATSIPVASATGITAGDIVMVFQTQRGTFTSSTQGALTLGTATAGTYDLVQVTAVAGTTLTTTPGLRGTYVTDNAQVIRVPQYTTVTIGTGATLTAPAWNGTTGGIVAFLATGAVINNGAIDVSNIGFRGGIESEDVCGGTCSCPTPNLPAYALADAPNCDLGGRGEGLGVGLDEYNPAAYGSRGAAPRLGCGIGNRSLGGGGGGHINAGGAGGSNGGRGGFGGRSWCSLNGFDNGGRPGQTVTSALTDILTFGGGGGGGQQNNNVGGFGGRGGGIVFMRAASLAGGGAVRANGQNGEQAANDGQGGGGAGGSIIGQFASTAICGAMQANGGNGTNQADHGPGGGGGGGRILLNASNNNGCAIQALGGASGTGQVDPPGGGAGATSIAANTQPTVAPFGCSSNADCSGATPICNVTSRVCQACP